jgi:hypothetical protein
MSTTITTTESVQTGDGVPRVTKCYGHPYGRPGPCVGCGQRIDRDDEYLALWASQGTRVTLLGAAHHGRYLDADWEHWDDTCPRTLHDAWEHHLAGTAACRLTLGADDGGQRFYAGYEPLHAGIGLDVLTASNIWLPGRFEYQLGTSDPAAYLYVRLAGYQPDAQPYPWPGTPSSVSPTGSTATPLEHFRPSEPPPPGPSRPSSQPGSPWTPETTG